MVQAVRAANAGETLLPHSVIIDIARRVAAAKERDDGPPSDRAAARPRELEVLRALTEGLSTPEICERLFIAPNTLRTHVQNIMGKLRVHSKLEAVAFALRNRLVEPPRQRTPSPSTERTAPAATVRSAGELSPSPSAASGDAGSAARSTAVRLLGGGPRDVRRVLAPDAVRRSSVAPLAVEARPAARAASLLGEERLERRDRVDLASAGPAGEPGHVGNLGWTIGVPRRRRKRFTNYVGWMMSDVRDPRMLSQGSSLRRPTGHSGRWPVCGPSRSPRGGPLSIPQTFGRPASAAATSSAGYS